MENRFGIKDLFVIALISIAIIVGILGIVQVNHQWDSIQSLKTKSEDNSRDLIAIRKMLAEGINMIPTTQSASSAPAIDIFKPITDAEKMPGFKRGDWFIDNTTAKIKALTPFVAGDLYSSWIQNKIMEGLVYRDCDSLDFVPLLATRWDISPDGKSIVFHLRHGVSFSDGEPFTADDVVFTFDWVRNPVVSAARARGDLEHLEEVKKIDDYTVEFKFKEFYFRSLETVGGMGVMSKHFYSAYTPDKFNESVGLLIGTGPYRLETPDGWSPGKSIVLYRNDRYWGKPPAPDRFVFHEVEEDSACETMFTNGSLDLFAATAEQYEKLKKDPSVVAKAKPMDYTYLLGGYGFIAWNERSKGAPSIFNDKRVRQAMTMLIDRESICKNVYLGYASVANGPFAPGSKQADPNIKPWPYDPARAVKLLKEAGIYDHDGDGVLDKPDGTAFRFKLTYANISAVTDRVTLYMKDGFAKAGVIMERNPVEWPVLQQKIDHREFDAVFLGWSGSVEEDPHQTFHSSQIADQGDDSMSYNSPECDAAIDAARRCVDTNQRMELWHKVHRIIAEDCPYTFMINRKVTMFLDNRWQNIRPARMGLNYNKLDNDPFPWFVPAGQQRYTK